MDDRDAAVVHARSAAALAEQAWSAIDPWGRYPGSRSRIEGLGGRRPLKDMSTVFETAQLVFDLEGSVRIAVELSGFEGGQAFMFLNLTNASTIDGSPEARLLLLPLELQSGQRGVQRYEIEFEAHRHIAYRLSGHIHGENPLQAAGLSLLVSRPCRALKPARRTPAPRCKDEDGPDTSGARGTARVYEEGVPSFDRLRSQPMTRAQFAEPAFLRLRDALSAFGAGSDADLWPEAVAIRAAEAFKVPARCNAIGFDAADGRLWHWLLRSGARVLLAERTFDGDAIVDMGKLRSDLLESLAFADFSEDALHLSLIGEALPPEYCGKYDFSWWMTAAETDWRVVARGALNVAESLNANGVGVACFPIAHGESTSGKGLVAETDLPRLILALLSAGHQIVQVCMPQARRDFGVTQFAFIIRNARSAD